MTLQQESLILRGELESARSEWQRAKDKATQVFQELLTERSAAEARLAEVNRVHEEERVALQREPVRLGSELESARSEWQRAKDMATQVFQELLTERSAAEARLAEVNRIHEEERVALQREAVRLGGELEERARLQADILSRKEATLMRRVRRWISRRPTKQPWYDVGSVADQQSKVEMNPEVDAYLSSGRIPWSKGYKPYRMAQLQQVVKDSEILEAFRALRPLPPGYATALDERLIEYPWVVSRLTEGEGKLFDAGLTLNFPYLLELPQIVGKKTTILTLAPERQFNLPNVS